MVTRAEAAYLLRRAGFGGSPAEIDALRPRGRASLVNAALVARDRAPAAPPEIADPAVGQWEKHEALSKWWFDRMIRSSFTDSTKPSPIVEKMTMFWHNHFATSWDKVFFTQWMHQQNATLRSYSVGNFRTLCQRVAIGPAMLIYLDNETNTKDAPNQNFARELMELFMLGIGNYTEDDVITAAAAWSGHNLRYDSQWRPLGYRFYSTRHDTVPRTFLGRTQVWNGPQTIDWILDNPATGPICAKFLCRKLWTWFATPNPSQTVVDALAGVLIANNWVILPVLRAMFLRPEFWEATTVNGLVRTPVEFAAATGKALNLSSDAMNPQYSLEAMGQTLFRPPNVSGWRPNEYWTSTSAMSGRADSATGWSWLSLQTVNPSLFVDIIDETLPSAERRTPADVVASMLDRFSIVSPSPELVQSLTDWCVTSRHEWTDAEPWNYWGERIHLVLQILMSREFQLN